MSTHARGDWLSFRSAGALCLVLLVFAAIWFAALGYRDLNEPDEGRYAEIPREMLATGNWITPRLDGLKYFEKPPLQYWATAASYELFGQSATSSRLWCAFLGFLSVPWIFYLGQQLFDRRAGLYAAAMLGGGMMWISIGHLNTLDMGVSALLTFAMGALLLGQSRRGDGTPATRNWMLFGWAMLAAATLSKGLIGVVLPGAAVVLYSLWQRDWAMWRHLHLGKGLGLFLLLCAPWFIAVARTNPTFLWFFFIHEHFLRYATGEAERAQPWWFFLVLLWVGFLPWLGSGLRAVFAPGFAATPPRGAFNAVRLLWTYGVFVVAFFSISDSKLVPYILPAYPAFALLAGRRLADSGPTRTDFYAAVVLGLALLGLTVNLHLFVQHDLPLRLLTAARPWLVLSGSLMLFAAAAGRWMRPMPLATVAFSLLALLSVQMINWGYQVLSPIYSSKALAHGLAPVVDSRTPVYSIGLYSQSLPFYLKHTIKLVDYRGELSFGMDRAPGRREIETRAEFAKLWRQDKQAAAVMKTDDYQAFKSAGLPMRVVYRDPRRVGVARR